MNLSYKTTSLIRPLSLLAGTNVQSNLCATSIFLGSAISGACRKVEFIVKLILIQSVPYRQGGRGGGATYIPYPHLHIYPCKGNAEQINAV